MTSYGPREFLQHIANDVDYLVATSADTTRDGFLADQTLQRAFVRSFESFVRLRSRFQTNSRIDIPKSSGKRWPECATG